MPQEKQDEPTTTHKDEKIHFPTVPEVYAEEKSSSDDAPRKVYPLRKAGTKDKAVGKTSSRETEPNTVKESHTEANLGGRQR